MHDRCVEQYRHEHDLGLPSLGHERRTLWVFGLTVVTMIVEIIAGLLTGSMALLADGWHMGTHAFALGISLTAYLLARRYGRSPLFAFGPGKFGVLAGYTSALFLGGAAVVMMWESAERLLSPVSIAFDQAILVAVIGLVINATSIMILHHRSSGHEHEHDQDARKADHDHDHKQHPGHDHNYRAAYLHVIADALTSVFAIVALLSGRYLGWAFFDPLMGLIGGLVICRWSWQLLRGTALILLDGSVDTATTETIRRVIEADGDSRVADLHVWRVSSNDLAGALSIVSGQGRTADEYQVRLADIPRLRHLTVEVQPCYSEQCCA